MCIRDRVETTGFPSHGFSDAEYVGMLGNLLDNAIEASVKTEHPWIALRSFMAGGQWVLRDVYKRQLYGRETDDRAAPGRNRYLSGRPRDL